jgi:sugar lactone lactonase YvrE
VETVSTTLFADGFSFGEGPRWHDDRLWFTDCPAGAVMTVDEAGRLEVALETALPSGLGWLPDGTMVISTMYEAMIKRAGPDGVSISHDLGDVAWATNDLVAGPDASIYVDLYNQTDDGIAGAIGLVDPDGEFRVVATELATPNGLAITPDRSTLIVSETFGECVLAFAIGADGSLSDRRIFAELGEGRHPDGICLDAEGAVWVGCYDTGEFLRVFDGGEITHRIPTERGWAIAPALGGPDRRTLYLIVNESEHLERRREVPDSHGRIEQARVDVPGAGWP